jgi:hypothetical protein
VQCDEAQALIADVANVKRSVRHQHSFGALRPQPIPTPTSSVNALAQPMHPATHGRRLPKPGESQTVHAVELTRLMR